MEKTGERISAVKDQLVEWRRHLHRHPELSFQEKETSQFIFDTLSTFGNIELERPTETSVLGRLNPGKPGPVLAIRADMDALPIDEQNDFDFVSENDGVMHACGHDGHTSMLLGTARVLSEMAEEIHGEVRFIFQHAEELAPGGAEELVEAGVLEGVDWVIGTHLWAPLEEGKIGIYYNEMMAAPDVFHITVTGKGGHAAIPQTTIDSIAIGAQVITNLQHIISRNTDPLDSAVLSVTAFNGGSADNVIPGSAKMMGTVRTFNPDLRAEMPKTMERVVKGITEAHGADYTFEYRNGYRPVINNEEVAKKLEATAAKIFGEEAVIHYPKLMVGEDFSAYLNQKPGAFFLVGAGNIEKDIVYPHHHEKFTVDEPALEKGVHMFVQSAIDFING